ncbi:MAG: hypothetical protein Q4F81_13670 [Eubacteriales bacterium]|nr:hypothetical protein [Eubacteriales bacterium]
MIAIAFLINESIAFRASSVFFADVFLADVLFFGFAALLGFAFCCLGILGSVALPVSPTNAFSCFIGKTGVSAAFGCSNKTGGSSAGVLGTGDFSPKPKILRSGTAALVVLADFFCFVTLLCSTD